MAKTDRTSAGIAEGSTVWIDFGYGEPVPATVIEDRGAIGVGGRRILRVELAKTEGEEATELEVPLDDLVVPPGKPLGAPFEEHVVPLRGDGWAVMRPGRTRPTGVFQTKREALGRARELVMNRGGGDVVVHRRDGAITHRDTYLPAAVEQDHVLRHESKRGSGSSEERYVVPVGDGWAVRKPGSGRVSSKHSTQREADRRAAEILRNVGGGERVTHGRDGTIRSKDTIRPARDPLPPRDKKH